MSPQTAAVAARRWRMLALVALIALLLLRIPYAASHMDLARDMFVAWRFLHGEAVPMEGPILAGTVHLGGTLDEIANSERQVTNGEHPGRPFVLVTQPTLFDKTRAPEGRHIAWAYCHVPNGSTFDMTARIENQLERFAPGFRDCILARHTMNCAAMQKRNANLIGGDINGGAADLWQLLARPILSFAPYRTAVPGIYLCSSSTPPGGGVHGMCGFHAARTAIRDCFCK